MRGNSNHYPEIFIPTIGMIQFRYNIEKIIKVEENKSERECYDYDYVNVADPVTRENLIEALVGIDNSEEIVNKALGV